MTKSLKREAKVVTANPWPMEPYEYIEWARIYVKASLSLNEEPRPDHRELAATALPWETEAPPESGY